MELEKTHFLWSDILLWGYLLGVLASLLLFIRGIVPIYRTIKQGKRARNENSQVILLPTPTQAWSLGKYIVMSCYDYEHHREEILTHERAHQHFGHLFDLCLVSIAQIVFWFNPVIHLIKKDLRDIHEYQADDYTLKSGINAASYQLLIIKKCVGQQLFTLAINFNHTYCQTKKRITMMNTMRKSGMMRWKALAFLPVLGLLVGLFSSANMTQTDANSDAKASLTLPAKWFKAGNAPSAYEMGIDPAVKMDGKNVVVMQSSQNDITKFGTLMQQCLPTEYLGKRVQMTGYMKSENVQGWGGIWMRIDKGTVAVAFDNMQSRAVKGTTEWKKYTIVLNVPSDATLMSYGVLLAGSGQLWLSDLSVEVVSDSISTTEMIQVNPANLLKSPTNLGLDK